MEETLEEDAEDFYEENAHDITFLKMAEFGAKWQQERSYSEEEVLSILDKLDLPFDLTKWFEQFKKK